MADLTYRIILHCKDEDGNNITSICPIAFRDVDETINWTDGTHIANGHWAFDILAGLVSGIKWAVKTGTSVWTEDVYLSGGSFSSTQKGMFVTNPMNIGG